MIIVALVDYDVPGFSDLRVVKRAFSVGLKSRLIDEREIKKASVEKIRLEDLILHPIGSSTAT